MVLLPDQEGRVLPVGHSPEGLNVRGHEAETELGHEDALDLHKKVLIGELPLHSTARKYDRTKEI